MPRARRTTPPACPFCGETQGTVLRVTTTIVYVWCETCKGQGPYAPTEEEAWLAWAWRGTRHWGICPGCSHWFRLKKRGQIYCDGWCRRRHRAWLRKRDTARLLAEAERIITSPP
jgi:hypothetical protein